MSMLGLQSAPCIRHSAFCPRRSARLSCRPSSRSCSGARQRRQVPATAAARDADTYYANWLALPIQPGSVRRTQRTTAGPGIFLFEQTQGVLEVLVNIRMTVLKLRDGSLFVYGPVAPTRECLRLLRELDAPVKYIVLPTSAVEHKVFLGPFAREFPDAEIYAAPGQWSWPLNLPLALLGLFPRKLNGTLGDGGLSDGRRAPWADELEHALLELPLGLGPFVEVVFFHKASRTLLVTDVVISVPEEPPQVCAADPLPLLVRSKDTVEPLPENTSEARLVGWAKTVLFALFFQPRAVSFGLRGFTWSPEWRDSFARLTRPKLIVPPILQTIVLNKRPATARVWINRVARWPFQRIIPAHLQAPVNAGPADFVAAFDFLPQKNVSAWVNPFAAMFAKPRAAAGAAAPFAEGDMRTLRSIGNLVSVLGVIKGAFPLPRAAFAGSTDALWQQSP